MADAGVARDPGRLPWLEPYRAPARKPSNRRPGVTAVIGAIGLVAVVTLLTRDMIPQPVEPASAPQASTLLPAPEDLQPQVVLPTLHETEAPVAIAQAARPRLTHSVRPQRRKIRAVPTAAAYREVVETQMAEAPMPEITQAALAIAAMPLPPDPPRPAVNPSAEVVRGKTVQLGVYLTAWPGRGGMAARGARLYLSGDHAEEHPADLDPLQALLSAAAWHAVEKACQATVHQPEVDRPHLHAWRDRQKYSSSPLPSGGRPS